MTKTVDSADKLSIKRPTIRLRQGHFGQPVEIVISRGNGKCETFPLTMGQLRSLAIDATTMALSSTTFLENLLETGKTADG